MSTNTVIVTNKSSIDPSLSVTTDDNVLRLVHWLNETILLKFQVEVSNPIQLIKIHSFKRLILVCPSRLIAKDLVTTGSIHFDHWSFNFSLTDTITNITKDYLKVPKSDKMFLVSPPTSPPPGFDYSRCEDQPNTNVLHVSETSTSYNNLNINNDNNNLVSSNVGSIVLERRASYVIFDQDDDKDIQEFKTAMPPRSVFDDDSDIELE
ncbi:hypothetical protein Kpol_1033p3 [Vanderwaltozyma polyspora DSM 70294]|uniref:Calcipressin-like protein n=1 Tax=Vanderwaltozyma polyspora (strain ATCC 22028 / DSM 70294 / BCRC 21397 / CBS 2163 / NBRC 10782 / NRRL Y-8283 / UCD 57-17) TaxID=436907 RepID=A7TJ01_VANPO|nr:uncharacterized protein Kpol_1033p3 [Vanderwaltozyma polyspora DSM 70294]EDO17700.1 hypothetical protein Kpol_1033p3 [Vanderwaltozyma polyspora DSM 70294]